MKTIIVTSGGTREYIDDVRVLTNISTGKLGALIAQTLFDSGFNVHYVYGTNAVLPEYAQGTFLMCPERLGSGLISSKENTIFFHPVNSVNDLYNTLKRLLDQDVHAVVHTMAVSDFTFTRTENVKCKSSSVEDFIEYMRKCITKTPKVISHIKQWNPNTFLIGFKFEVGVSYDTLKALAQESIEKNSCDLVMTNDKVEMTTKKSHIGHFFFSTSMHSQGFTDKTVNSKSQIAQEINKILQEID
jgi:phosphopantothenate-cysteine ligase